VLANPQLRAVVGTSATAQFGERVPIPITTFSPIATGGIAQQPITSFQYENIGVNIDITPRTHLDNDVTLAIAISVSSISGTGFGGLPTIGNRLIKTQIRLKDGETNMLAGLIRDDERRVRDGIPGLSDLPGVGHLFGRSVDARNQTDVILMLTPRIVRVLQLTEDDLRAFNMGRDAGVSPIGPLGVPGGVELPLPDDQPKPQPGAPQPPPAGPPGGPQPILPPAPAPPQPDVVRPPAPD
jgi:general secretion pathway protein D